VADGDRGKFSAEYADGSFARGDFIHDVFRIGDIKLENTTMGLGSDTDISFGLLGIGYTEFEAPDACQENIKYDNIPVSLAKSGAINSVAYSLWLNDLSKMNPSVTDRTGTQLTISLSDSPTGNVLFGGIDTTKFEGNLARLDILENQERKVFDEFVVQLSSMSIESDDSCDIDLVESPLPVLLDSGTTNTVLPDDIFRQLKTILGATHIDQVPDLVVPCNLGTDGMIFSFQFQGEQGPKIRVNANQFATRFPDPIFFDSGPNEGNEACALGVESADDDIPILGDTFLRSAYVVHDLVNNQIGIANAKFNVTESNIVPFTSMGATIPSSTPVPK
jgi:hypothetical protein